MTNVPGDVGLYPAEDGTIHATFKKGDAGLAIEDLLPASGRGDGFENFPIADYFDYAHLWFATAAQIDGLNQKIAKANLLPGQTTKVSRVPIDLKAYKLLGSGNVVDNGKLREMFLAVAVFWEQANPVNPIPGLFHNLYQQGMPLHNIAVTILRTRELSGMNSDGTVDLKRAKADPLYQITEAAFEGFREYRGLMPDVLFQQSEIDEFSTIWRRWTRSDGETTTDVRDAHIIWQDYRRLRLIDHRGGAITANAKRLALHILEQADAEPDFEALVSWAEAQFEQQVTAQATQSKASQKALRKKRKMGRVNRKRGRR